MMMRLGSVVKRFRSHQGRQLQSASAAIHSQRRQSSFLDSITFSVVKVLSITRLTDSLHPWRFSDVEEGNGSGFVISGRRIITNAHVVTGSTYVQIMKMGSGTKYKASIQAFGHGCDLAMLVVDSEEFWKDLKPLDLLSEMPRLFQTVRVVGYPEASPSPVESFPASLQLFTVTANLLPAFQVDAAINNGNSGGPVFIGKSVAGIAFEGLDECQNIWYVIPSPLLLLFLSSIERNKGVGSFCSLGVFTQPMENTMMRDYFGMKEKMTGIVVTRVYKLSRRIKTLMENDVLLAVNGNPIQNDGEVSIGINLEGFIALKKPMENVCFDVLRKGVISQMTLRLSND
ncbi:unnamed protein product [Arabis nemorensis]|uniref:PDZ domain-containing protein n=1 Tax=Arabis nemorensis TaxID=586526 RepID=A0A565B6K9_9BRAS|nr:unnamed protein product [Arabis nemorensis]